MESTGFSKRRKGDSTRPKDIPGEGTIEPATAYEAALTLAGVAIDKEDPSCGLATVLDALALREKIQEHKTSPKKVQ